MRKNGAASLRAAKRSGMDTLFVSVFGEKCVKLFLKKITIYVLKMESGRGASAAQGRVAETERASARPKIQKEEQPNTPERALCGPRKRTSESPGCPGGAPMDPRASPRGAQETRASLDADRKPKKRRTEHPGAGQMAANLNILQRIEGPPGRPPRRKT